MWEGAEDIFIGARRRTEDGAADDVPLYDFELSGWAKVRMASKGRQKSGQTVSDGKA